MPLFLKRWRSFLACKTRQFEHAHLRVVPMMEMFAAFVGCFSLRTPAFLLRETELNEGLAQRYAEALNGKDLKRQGGRFARTNATDDPLKTESDGQERAEATVRLARLNLAVHGLEGQIRQGNSYYEDLHQSVRRFDFVLANPPFNVDAVDKERLMNEVGAERRFPFGLPRTDNANYLWIQLFYACLI